VRDDYWEGKIGGGDIEVDCRSSLDMTKTGSEVGLERRKIDGGWFVGRDRDEWRWRGSVGGWRKGKDIDSEGNWLLVNSSEQTMMQWDGQRWIHMR
jgi:hypothetical protein